MSDIFELRARAVVLAYRVIKSMELPPAELTDKEVLLSFVRAGIAEARKISESSPTRHEQRPDSAFQKLRLLQLDDLPAQVRRRGSS